MTDFSKLSENFKKLLEEEKKARNTLQGYVDSAKKRVTKLEDAVNPDSLNYWSQSINSCGGILISQMGRIVYKDFSTTLALNERCVWTVRANQRSKVKVRFIGTSISVSGFVAITELSQSNETLVAKTTKITQHNINEVHLIDGPVIFITLYTDSTENGQGFSLEFEGVGSNISPKIDFKHLHITDYSGLMSYPAETATDRLSKSVRTKRAENVKPREVVTLVINPHYPVAVTANVTIRSVDLHPDNCSQTSLHIYNNLLSETSHPEGCCSSSCEQNSFEAYDGLFLMILSSDQTEKSKFEFAWALDTTKHEVESIDTCGGVLNGRVGRISYKLDQSYSNNERCVWTIKPLYKSSIKVLLSQEGLEEGYDFLKVTEINNDLLDRSGPNTTILARGSTYTHYSGPVIFVTFYSDSSQTGTGFLLEFEAVGNTESSGSGLSSKGDDRHVHHTEESGIQTYSGSEGLLEPHVETFVINPQHAGSHKLKLILKKLEDENFKSECGFESLSIYRSEHANYSSAASYCSSNEEFKSQELISLDAIFIVVIQSKGSLTTEFAWEKGEEIVDRVVGEGEEYVQQLEGCGGVLTGDSGKISYKLEETYDSNERCIWTVRALKRSKITLKLVKDGFESCCDYIVVTELTPEQGTLNNETTKIDRQNRLRSFEGPIIFVTFYSDHSVTGTGFTLEFETTGKELLSPFHYHNFHLSQNRTGTVTYPLEVSDSAPENSTHEIITYVISPTDSNRTNLNITINQLNIGFDDKCDQDSLTLYSFQPQDQKVVSELKLVDVPCTGTETDSTCGKCTEGVSHDGKVVSSLDGISIVIVKSVSTNNVFNFSWEQLKEEEYDTSNVTASIIEILPIPGK